ncbi:MAG TPA: WYL domain-containing protein, partial [Anaeromyxobacteraceae bacterium]|nr:WYL domain-containing protein [Anaeromyxobacteraceae bacterium]
PAGAREGARVSAAKARKRRSPAARGKAGHEAGRADPRDRLRRVLFLVPYAVRHPGIPVRELARKCGVSETELLDDLEFLLGVGAPPFAPDDFLDLYVEGDRVYVALHQSFSRPPRFTESEAAALAAAARALGGEGRERVVKALRDSVPPGRREGFDELVERIYAGAPPAPDSVLGRLQRAIAERRAVTLAYRSASSAAPADRTVHPYTLAQRLGHWYLYGHDSTRARALAFRVDRIQACTLGDARFEPPSDAELARARLFSEPSGEPIRFRLGPVAAAWALGRPGLDLVKNLENGGALVEVAGADEAWATRFALSFGGGAEVVGPATARRHFAEAVRRTLARYG